MSSATFENLADPQLLYLTTIGWVTGRPREIEIWFIVHHEKFYVFSEHREAAGWVKNIRDNPNVSVRFEKCSMKAVAQVLDYRKERQLLRRGAGYRGSQIWLGRRSARRDNSG
jgi:deazaflavin-dependent oxidoreductase (nitroreductase family)